jgi:hypothetical protein
MQSTAATVTDTGVMRIGGLALRHAALIVGLAYLLNPVSYAEFALLPKLLIPGNVEQTVANISAHHGMFLATLFCYFLNFIEDIIIAWALYILLTPVNQALSLLAALFQLVYAGISILATFNLATAYRLLVTPEFATAFGTAQLHAQVDLLVHTFRYDYSLALVIFGIHLILVGYLVARSRYIPFWLGVILVINGLGWVVYSVKPYLYPSANLEFIMITFGGELIFMIWLLVRGWAIKEPG